MRKKYLFLSFLIVCFILGAVSVAKPLNAEASAAAEIAMELSTETVLRDGNADARLPMASTTKIMTALIIVEDCNLDEVITVPDKAVGVEGSSIYLKKGEQIDIRDLLYGLMLRSGNDSATALAIHHSGSVEKFVEVMNNRAKKIGVESTNFANPSGLPDDSHYTTARDLCKIACYAMRNETFRQVVSTKTHKGNFRTYANKNKMLYTYEGANGVKTGYTLKAGRCLVSSAERNGMDVVTVVLNCPDMYERSKAIFDYAFENFKLLNLSADSVFSSNGILCKLSKPYKLVVKNGENFDYKVVPLIDGNGTKKGDLVARLEIYDANGLIFNENLYSIVDNK
ncbi:MAG: D-alanyl-D-alanine carboxypeptidase [Clostridia bacterium]|nr:D-alanyl-D-alanine carboxypeptidase [Clostridia bacterium]